MIFTRLAFKVLVNFNKEKNLKDLQKCKCIFKFIEMFMWGGVTNMSVLPEIRV